MRVKVQEWKSRTAGKLLTEKNSAADRVEELFDILYEFASDGRAEPTGDMKLRLKDETRARPGWSEVTGAFKRLEDGTMTLVRSIGKLCREADDAAGDGYMAERLSGPIIEMKALGERLEGYLSAMEALINPREDDGLVRWIEAPANRGGRVISICGSPLNVAEAIKERVYDCLSTVIITSATLTVKNNFKFLSGRIGLDLLPGDRLMTGLFPSPFDYKNQMIIGIPSDIPNPTSPEFADALAGLVTRSVELSDGRAFVLFTSYGLLSKVHRQITPGLEAAGMSVMRQGDEPRHKLLERFKRDRYGVLFATDSFWEGVDVSGSALSNVIITKLPFSVPDDPVVEARQEEIAAKGGNAFMQYIVPQAVIKFRQGFGRLIRTRTDRGSIMVFDRRVIEKGYGREFIGSLPEGTVVRGQSDAVFGRVAEFFEEDKVAEGA
jgi:ATP-dependent DNA helicase DinG